MIRTAMLGILACAGLLTACGTGSGSGAPSWKPAPSFQGENAVPGDPQPNQPGAPIPNQPPGAPSSSTSGTPAQDPNVVATHLTAPTGVVVLPDKTALVGERTTGRIVRVQPEPGGPVRTVRTLTGLSTVGGGGLLDLALSPNYTQDNLIFAYLTTPTDNRVVTFTLTGPVTPVLTGIPRGTTDNTGRITFAADGSLLVGTGDAGHPALAANPHSLAGKVLRVTDIGRPAPGNPIPGSRIWTSGHEVVDGLCVSAAADAVFETESRGDDRADPVNVLEASGDYGWPAPTADYRPPLTTLPAAAGSPGGCAVLDNRLVVTSRNGTELLLARIGGGHGVGAFTPLLHGRYGRLLTVVAAPDGALWITTSNRDGHGKPVAADERVLRIVPSDDNAGDAT